ncbi:MAG: hypothetical protein IGS38_10920 [Synechococcales cyanobacterium M58_A2018_015]|nr:hypothetical protein [Synechococcales cyanobacterium M58_A2018_015]
MAFRVRSLTVGLTAGLAAAAVALGGCSGETNTVASSPSPVAPDGAASNTSEAADSPEVTAANPGSNSRVVEGVVLEPGSDPLAMVFELRRPNTEAMGSEQLRLNFPAPDRAVVIMTQTGLPDDSVAAIRTRYEFELGEEAGASQPLWQLTQVTQQNKCQPGRGPQDWTGDLCS